jgi:predicted Zn-dependent protease
MLRQITLLIITATLLVGCATSPTGRRQLMLVSEQNAIVASKEAYLSQMGELDAKGVLNTDPKDVARVDRITGRLIAQAIIMRPDTRDWEWSVEVIDDPKMVNAWCMAGGRMAIYTGLLQQIEPTDDELAQVMGHEIAHALANHTAERMSVAMASSAGVLLAGVLSNRPAATMAGAAAAATVAVKLPNSRTSESEADQIGIELAAKAGYNPDAAATLWQKMGTVGGEGPPQFLSSHPAPSNRQQVLSQLAPQMAPYYREAKNGTLPTYPIAGR